MSSAVLTPPELGRLAGPLLIGYIMNWGLFGVLSMQVYVYYLAFPNDRTIYKALVYGAFLLEATQTFMFTSSAFRTFAIGFGNPDVLDQIDILWFSLPIMSGLVAFLAQTFYAYRITDLSKHNYISVLIMLLSFVQLGGSIANGIDTKKASAFSHFLRRDALLTAGIWEGGSAACNVLIATAMIYYSYLRDTASGSSKKRNTAHPNLFVTKVIRMFVETGVVSAILAIITLILTFLPGRPNYYQASISILGKVYANSMMVTFNSRLMIGAANAAGNANTTVAHEMQNGIALSQNSRNRTGGAGAGMGHEIDLSRSIGGGGVLVTREEISFPQTSSSEGEVPEKDVKRPVPDDDIYDTPFPVSTK